MSSPPACRPTGRGAPRPPRPLPLLALLALLVGAPAAAAPPRIAVGRVKGDPSGDVGAQLVSTLCSAHRCMPGRVDASRARLARARKQGVEAVVLAAVRRERGRREVSVSLVTCAGRTLSTWRLPLGRDRQLPAHRLEGLADEIQTLLRPGSRPLPAPPPAGAPPQLADPAGAPAPFREASAVDAFERRPSLRARQAPAPRVEDLPVLEVITIPRSQPEEAPPPRPWGASPRQQAPPRSQAAVLPPLFAADAAVDTARHALAFPSSGTAPVGYVVNLLAVPRLRLETHPLGGLEETVVDLGLFAEGAYVPGLDAPSETRTLRVAYLRARGGALWRWRLEGGLVLRPALAWEVERVSVRVDRGARFPGLPDTALSGPSLGLDLTQPLGAGFSLVGGGRAIWWFQAGELAGGAHYFPGGRALGLEAEAGAAYRLGASFTLGLLLCHATTLWWLDPDPSGAYTVTSARAATWGARAWLRLEL